MIPRWSQNIARHKGESACPELWDGLVSCWLPVLGPTGGTVHDLGTHKNNGAFTNMSVGADWVTTPIGWAVDVDGSNDYLNVGSHSSLNITSEMTVVITTKIPTQPGGSSYRVIMGFYNVSSPYQGFAIGIGSISNNGKISYYTNNHGAWVVSSSTVDDSLWHHIAVAVDGSNCRFYIDGSSDASPASDVPSSYTGTRCIGSRSNGTQNFQGEIEQVRIYKRLLTQSEIAFDSANPYAFLEPRTLVTSVPAVGGISIPVVWHHIAKH